jgi:hypothetical protein
MTLDTVVVPIDGSTLSRRAVPAATSVAAASQAKVRLVTVAHNDGELAWAYDQVHAAAELVTADMAPSSCAGGEPPLEKRPCWCRTSPCCSRTSYGTGAYRAAPSCGYWSPSRGSRRRST